VIIIYSKNKIPIRLTQERWAHITRRHPELQNQKSKVEETISNPEFIQEGDYGELLAIRFYSHTLFGPKYLIVAYKEVADQDGFVLTAYFTNLFSKRRHLIWKS